MKTLSHTRLGFLLICFIILNCSNPNTQDQLFLEKKSPSEIVNNSEPLESLISNIKNDKIKNVHALILIKDDFIVLEEYFNGYDRNRLQYSASVTKSFASALMGIAIDKGFFEMEQNEILETNVSSLFPKYRDLIEEDKLKNKLKLKHILSMSAGFEWDEQTYGYSDNRNDCNRINNSDDPMKFLLNRKLESTPGAYFEYNGGLSLAISYLLEQATKKEVKSFSKKHLFQPLAIKNFRWEKLNNGLYDTDGGLHISAIDQSKFGYLFLNNGEWNGQQILSEKWVLESTTMHVNNSNMPDYGFQWWGGEYAAAGKNYQMYLASGYGGQKIVVIPEFKTVLVITQQVFENPYADINFIAIMSDYIIPALIKQTKAETFKSSSIIDWNKYTGKFSETGTEEYIEMKYEEGQLRGYSSDGQINIFEPISTNVFKTRIMDLIAVNLEYQMDSNNKVSGIKSNFAFNKKNYRKVIN